MRIEPFYDPRTFTLTYLVWDEETSDAVVIDPVLDFDPLAIATFTESADKVSAFIDQHGLRLHWVLETHAHADHLSGSQILKERHGAKVAIGSRITEVQTIFKGLFHMTELKTDGSQFDALVGDGEVIEAGALSCKAIATPGHTPACVTWSIGDALFTGDALFMPDFGTGRCDFPEGSAEQLYESLTKIYAHADETRIFVGHDYQPGGREVAWETTVGESKANNIQMRGDTSRERFVSFRTERDKKLRPPRLIFQSVQVNVAAGVLPTTEENGMRYLKMPMDVFAARP